MIRKLCRLDQFIFIGLILTCSSLLHANNQDVQMIQKQYQYWCNAMGNAHGDAKKIVRFYAPDAILLPTLSPDILINRHGGLNDYFASLTAHHQFKCTPHRLMTQREGSVAINSGTYTFSYLDQHQHLKKVPARFTFVYHKTGNEWMIVNHHSSMLPEKK